MATPLRRCAWTIGLVPACTLRYVVQIGVKMRPQTLEEAPGRTHGKMEGRETSVGGREEPVGRRGEKGRLVVGSFGRLLFGWFGRRRLAREKRVSSPLPPFSSPPCIPLFSYLYPPIFLKKRIRV